MRLKYKNKYQIISMAKPTSFSITSSLLAAVVRATHIYLNLQYKDSSLTIDQISIEFGRLNDMYIL